MDDSTLADRCAAAVASVKTISGTGDPPRRTALVCGVRLAVLGDFDDPWVAQADLTDGFPGAAALADVIGWLVEHGPGAFMLTVRERDADHPGWARAGVVRWSAEPVFAIETTAMSGWPAKATQERVRPPNDVEEFRVAYDSWVANERAVRQLVVADDLLDPSRAFLVAMDDDVVVGSAIVRFVAGTGYLSGIGVHPDHRRRGIGSALTLAAARLAARNTEVVWLHASDEGSRVYRSLGFREVDTHVSLVPVRTA